MKNKTIFIATTLLLLVMTVTLSWLYFKQKSDIQTETLVTNMENVDSSDNLKMEEYIQSLPTEELSENEIAGLILMREEEKLARDVYLTLYEEWNQKIFNNIAKSEQTHTDTIKDILDKYNLEDPVTDDNNIGVFQNETLSNLYTDLVELGSQSLNDALTVGATVEDLDIKDLEDLMLQTDNQDILAAYQNLQKGSRNHLRSFTRVINRNGEEYTPQYISEDMYYEIITSPSENGITYNSTGDQI